MAGVNQVAATVELNPTRGRGSVPLTGGMSLVAGSGLLTWWSVGVQDSGDDYLLRSLESVSAPAWLEPLLGFAGCALLVLAVALMSTPAKRHGPRVATTSIALLAAGAAFVGAAWRVICAATVGVNFAGALLAFMGPALLALLAMAAVRVETRRRHVTWKITAGALVMIGLGAGALEVLLLRLA